MLDGFFLEEFEEYFLDRMMVEVGDLQRAIDVVHRPAVHRGQARHCGQVLTLHFAAAYRFATLARLALKELMQHLLERVMIEVADSQSFRAL